LYEAAKIKMKTIPSRTHLVFTSQATHIPKYHKTQKKNKNLKEAKAGIMLPRFIYPCSC